jgi:hypothetical protein
MDKTLALLFPSERTGTVELRSTAAGLVSKRQPGEALKTLTFRRTALTATTSSTSSSEPNLADAAWSNVLSGASTLWYARRRSFPYKPAVIGQQVVEPDDVTNNFTRALVAAELYDEFGSLPTRATALAIAGTHAMLVGFTVPDGGTSTAPFPTTPAETPFLFASIGGQILRQKWVNVETLKGENGVEKRNTYANRGKGLVKLSDKRHTEHGNTLPLPAVARARSVVALDKYAHAATEEQLKKLAAEVDAQLKAGGSLDDAATKLSIPF